MTEKTILESAIVISPQMFIDDEYKSKIKEHGCDVLADGVDGLIVDVERVINPTYGPTNFYRLIWRRPDSFNEYSRGCFSTTKLIVIWWPQIPHMIV